jgi:O-antigen/teichoic acid export membrane protein
MLSFLAHAVMGHYRQLLIAFNFQGAVFRIMAIGALVNVAANLLLIPLWDIQGAAVAALIAGIVVLALSYLLTWRHIRHIPLGRYFIRPAIAALLMAPTLLPPWHLFLRILIGGVVYVAALFLLRVISRVEVQEAAALLRPQKRGATIVGHSER